MRGKGGVRGEGGGREGEGKMKGSDREGKVKGSDREGSKVRGRRVIGWRVRGRKWGRVKEGVRERE